ncbi:MAG: Hpt domain-containing protein [Pseudomonadales bacterium]
MGESHDLMNLDWVQADIEQSLLKAQEALEAYLEDAVSMHLQTSYDAIHQVRGSLQMAGVSGAVMLAEEIESLLKAMLDEQAIDNGEACNALAQALVYMPSYLSRIKSGDEDSPALLQTVVNDIRRVLGEEPLDELVLFSPDLGEPRERASDEVKDRFDLIGQSDLRKLRQVYQFALVGLIRKEEIKVNTARLSNVLARLRQICQDAPINQLWEVATAFIESLLHDGTELNNTSLGLLRSLEREIKEFIRAGVFALDRQAHPVIMKGLLYYVAKSSQTAPHIQSIRQAYDLDRYDLGDAYGKKTSLLAGPDPETFKTVASALGEELVRIKDAIDLYVRNTDKSSVDLDVLLSGLNQISSTLVMLNLEAPRLVVQEQIDALSGKIQAGEDLSDSLLLNTAEALLFIEAELESLAGNVRGVDQGGSSALVGAAADVVISESLSSLRKAKDMIHAFMADDKNFSLLERVPNTLRSAYGGLAMLSQSATAQLVLSVSQYVEDDILAQQRAPSEEAIEALAEVMASVEFCLEGVSLHQPANKAVLERANINIARLGYPVEQTDGISSDDATADSYEIDQVVDSFDASEWHDTSLEPLDDASSTDEPGGEFEFVEEQPKGQQEDAELVEDDIDEEITSEPVDAFETIEFELPANEFDEVSNIEAVDSELMLDVGGDLVDLDNTEYLEQPAEAEAEAEAEADDDLIDDEILEIFSEEAQEVFEEIDIHWPVYVADNSNLDALKEVRRAFHTLKGSGRMVKASIISELSWSIEDMINRLLEGELAASSSICELVNDVRPALPTLLSHFESKTAPDIDVQPWIERAEAIMAGETFDAGDASDSNETADIPDVPAVEDIVEESDELSSELLTAELDNTFDESLEPLDDAESFAEFDEPIADQEPTVEQESVTYEAFSEYQEPSDDEGPEDLLDEALPEVANLVSAIDDQKDGDEDDEDSDTVLYELFVKETEQHLATLQDFINTVHPTGEPVLISDELYRALHTLKGSAKMAALDVFASVAEPTEELSIALINAEEPVDAEVLQALRTAHDMMAHAASNLPEYPQQALEGSEDFIAQLKRLTESFTPQAETEQVSVSPGQGFIRDHIDRICDLTDGYEDWRQQPQADSAELEPLHKHAKLLREAADEVDMPPLQKLLAGIENALARVLTQQVQLDDAALDALDAANNGLIGIFDQVAASEAVTDTGELVNRLEADLQPTDIEPEQDVAVAVDMPEMIFSAPVDSAPQEEPDAELVEIFLEEADEILEQASAAKQRWIEDSADTLALDELQRCLHTLKGGARMAGIMAVGDLSHELESVYEFVSEGKLGLTPALYDIVHACDDRIVDMLGELKTQLRCGSADDLISRVQHYRHTGDVKVDDTASAEALLQQLTAQIKSSSQPDIDASELLADMRTNLDAFQNAAYQASLNEAGDLCLVFGEVLATIDVEELPQEAAQTELSDWLERLNTSYNEAKQELERVDIVPSAAVPTKQDTMQQDARKPAQDNVRVSSALLEQLVDLAGETSVSSSRVEQQVNNYGYSIEEVGSTVERLREQLRRLENETEIQILFRQEREGPTHEGFDPLEMDRYSRMQELSRALMESVSDLFDLKETLTDQVRITENLLLQQSRTNTELHEGLMKARMVPFSRVVPRLRRIVRQLSSELNKQVDLDFKNPETELDRSLLEHMTAPLEHMVRNALDHGIEAVDQRVAAGKSDTGQVTLRLNRDGGDIVLELQDDGAGIAIDRVRAKAIERGLMAADAKLTDHEVLQFILQQGFSTAEKVTQISGRGVGMDVVHSEIRQLGGSISISSEVGQGTCFTVRLPFTVSISRALMVNVGEETFALPLSSIEGVVRINPYELEEYFKEDGPEFEYAGVKYDLHYLGDFVGRTHGSPVQAGVLPLPVILVRTSDHAIAVQVDSISGSREVVVKPLGPQLSNVPGMSGATILGDGSVVLILDMASMIREHLAKEGIEYEEEIVEAVPDHLRVMVVDDSVTVRKVASRLLERHGMEVILAKDGVEAMTKLQEVVPTIMLLDIEMPRMDGFELASLMRHDEMFSHIPIVMISSRTGEKHQARAREIGVNRFMGKPFQESDLLEAISELTGAEFEAQEA